MPAKKSAPHDTGHGRHVQDTVTLGLSTDLEFEAIAAMGLRPPSNNRDCIGCVVGAI
jgi:hypothetical protein